jgi:putative tryptophan/tyrosine transport system substrate-binding protein
MRRREFIAGLGSAVAWPAATTAQQPPVLTIGFLSPTPTPVSRSPRIAAFIGGLADAGYIEGRNVVIEYRWADGRYDRLAALAADLVRLKVAVLVATGGTPSALAAKAATSDIPIVFQIGSDPIEFGLVSSLAQPGGNLTGVTSLSAEVVAKRLELLHELVPGATTIALLVNPASPFANVETKRLEAAASLLGIRPFVLHASNPDEIADAFAALERQNPAALVVGDDTALFNATDLLLALALRHKVAAIYQWHEVVSAGGLMSYGEDLESQFRIVGNYAGRILRGERPSMLPVQQATKVELFINLKTAKALGITFPQTLLARADKVIE